VTLQGVDYSTGPITAAQAKASGVSFICRYVSSPAEQWKNLKPSEVTDFLSNGVGLVVVFEEHPVGRPLGGYTEGAANARSADAQVEALGIAGCPIYFAIDFDATVNQLATIDAYIDGAASVVGHARIGAYGSHRTITHLFDGGRIRYGWAAVAWGGTLDPRAHLYQYGGGTVAGVNVDWNRTVASDFDYGQVGGIPPIGLLEALMADQEALDRFANDVANKVNSPDGALYKNDANIGRALTSLTNAVGELNRQLAVVLGAETPAKQANEVSVSDQVSHIQVPSRVAGYEGKEFDLDEFFSGMDQKSSNNGLALAELAKAQVALAEQITAIAATLAAQDDATAALAAADAAQPK